MLRPGAITRHASLPGVLLGAAGLLTGWRRGVPPAHVPPRVLAWQYKEPYERGAGGYEIVQIDARGDGIRFIRTVGDRLYFLTLVGDVITVPLEGGDPSTVASGIPSDARADADAKGIYFVTTDCKIWTAPRRMLGACSGEPRWIRVDGDRLYVLTEDAAPASAGTTLWQIPKTGGAPRELTRFGAGEYLTRGFLVDDQFIYYPLRDALIRVPRKG